MRPDKPSISQVKPDLQQYDDKNAVTAIKYKYKYKLPLRHFIYRSGNNRTIYKKLKKKKNSLGN